MKTHLAGHDTLGDRGVPPPEPTGSVRATAVVRDTGSWHFDSCCALEAVPTASQELVAFEDVSVRVVHRSIGGTKYVVV